MPLPEVHLAGGTCVEAVRLAPVATAMRELAQVEPVLLAAGPDPLIFTRTLGVFGLAPGLAVPALPDPAPGPAAGWDLTAAPEPVGVDLETVRRLDQLWSTRTPDAVVVHGDAGASLPAAIAAGWRRIPVVHLDAGCRSSDLGQAGPVEAGRRLLAQLSTLHLAATPLAAMNLLDERVPAGDVLLTGNTSADAALAVRDRRSAYTDPALAALRDSPLDGPAHRLLAIGVTRTDGVALELVRATARRLAARFPDLDVVMLGTEPSGRSRRVIGTGPLSYADRARLLSETYLVLTDDGDLLEEAISFRAPALVLPDLADRWEPLHAGCARLVGRQPGALLTAIAELLDGPVRRDTMATAGNPYGDGLAARRAAQATAALLGHGRFPEPMPALSQAGVSR